MPSSTSSGVTGQKSAGDSGRVPASYLCGDNCSLCLKEQTVKEKVKVNAKKKEGRKEEDPNAGLVTQAEPKTQLLLAGN